MHITPGSTGTEETFTFSTWLKRGNLTAVDQHLFSVKSGSYHQCHIYLSIQNSTSHNIYIYFTDTGGNVESITKTTASYRDISAWYHIVVAVDTTQSTDTNRVKIYVNGTLITAITQHASFSKYPDQNFVPPVSKQVQHEIGRREDDNKYFDGYMAEVVLIDGTQYAASDFGEFNEDSPTIWQPKDVSGLTFGTNGFYLDFEDSANLGADSSGNSNDLTETNLDATDQATDTPTNNFATLNPLDNFDGGTLAQGNTYYTSVSSKHDFVVSTIGMSAGKWYAEFKIHQDTDYNVIGISDHGYQGSNQELSEDNYSYAFTNYDASNSIVRGNGSTILSSMPLFGNGDIVCVAVDLDNHKLYFRKNGDAWINSGDPESGATGTGAVSIQDLSSVSSSYGQGVYFFGVGLWNTDASGSYDANFGNPAFAITSSNADGNGYGNFEYDVPSGYLALCTKNLGSDGG
jgi:hypothetical protein